MVIIKLLYGIAEAGTYWWIIYFKHHCEQLNMETSTYNPCLLIITADFEHFGMIEMQTDDIFVCVTKGFQRWKPKSGNLRPKISNYWKKTNRCSLTAVFYPSTVTFCNYARKTRIKSWKSLQMPNRTFDNKLVARISQ
jgi:hypothetical protein